MEEVFERTKKGLDVPDQSLGPGLKVPRTRAQLQRTEEGCLILNDKNLQILCQSDGLYEYPEMNKKIYLHYKVIDRVYGLQKFVNLKSLYLENNVIRKIQNIGHLIQLQNLFLQNNMITTIEGLDKLKELKILNLSNNTIFSISGLFECGQLQSLTLSNNYLSDFASVEHLGQCSTTLTSIDLSNNKVAADERMFDLIPQVKCLYLSGNPVVKDTNHYRRTVVGKLPNLMYLDQRGVDNEQKMQAEAWIQDGEKGFRAARDKILSMRKQLKMQNRSNIMENIDVHRKKKIYVFQNNILEAQQQIEKTRSFMREPGNEDQQFFYESRVAELMQKIKENQEFIDSLYKRLGIEPLPPVYSIDLQLDRKEEESDPVQERQDIGGEEVQVERAPSEGQSQGQSEESVESGVVSEESGNSNPISSVSSHPSSLQTYNSLDELD